MNYFEGKSGGKLSWLRNIRKWTCYDVETLFYNTDDREAFKVIVHAAIG